MLFQGLSRICAGAICLLSAFLVANIPVHADAIDQLVVFGDSLSDNGNAAIALGGTLPGNYAPNAFTDGPATTPATTGPYGLWIDQLAADLGVTDPQPFLLGGTNYAVASALTGHNPAFTLPPSLTSVPYVTDQVDLYLLSGNTPSASTLYTFWAGANDTDSGGNPIAAADNIFENIQTLAADGATNFMWLNLPPLGDTPDGVASGESLLLNAASNAYDAEWAADIATLQGEGIDVDGVNVDQLFDNITADPSAYGLTNTTSPAWCGTLGQSLPACAANNPNQFLYWDGEHPTTAADAQIASFAFNSLTPAPEPGSLSLTFFGLCALLVVIARTRRKVFSSWLAGS